MGKRTAPYWPLTLRRDLAAVALDMTLPQFERAVASGELPQPIMLGGEERWSVKAIETAIGKLTGEEVDDWRTKQREVNRHAA